MSEFLYCDIHTHNQIPPLNTISVINLNTLNILPTSIFQLLSTQYYSIGIHPWFINTVSLSSTMANIEKALFTQPNIIALGETGLDKIYNSNFRDQIIFLHKHFELATIYKKPLILHCVKAVNELLAIKQSYKNVKCIIHGFS